MLRHLSRANRQRIENLFNGTREIQYAFHEPYVTISCNIGWFYYYLQDRVVQYDGHCNLCVVPKSLNIRQCVEYVEHAYNDWIEQ